MNTSRLCLNSYTHNFISINCHTQAFFLAPQTSLSSLIISSHCPFIPFTVSLSTLHLSDQSYLYFSPIVGHPFFHVPKQSLVDQPTLKHQFSILLHFSPDPHIFLKNLISITFNFFLSMFQAHTLQSALLLLHTAFYLN